MAGTPGAAAPCDGGGTRRTARHCTWQLSPPASNRKGSTVFASVRIRALMVNDSRVPSSLAPR
jgi:hypothetical protein